MSGLLLNAIRVSLTSATGVALTLGTKITGFNSPSDNWSGAVDGTVYTWVLEANFDVNGIATAREGGYGVYTASGGTLARNTIWSTSTANAQISITGTTHVIISPMAQDLRTGGTGTSLLDFGAFPGAVDTSLAVTGQARITATSTLKAWIQPLATADHSVGEHYLAPPLVVAGEIVAGTGFTIRGFGGASSRDYPLAYGKWNVSWSWDA